MDENTQFLASLFSFYVAIFVTFYYAKMNRIKSGIRLEHLEQLYIQYHSTIYTDT